MGGARGAANAKSDSLGGQDRRGEATLVIEGGFLDMSVPAQEQALARALQDLSGRRVTIVRR